MTITIRPAVPADIPTILRFVRELAAYEREPDAVEATEAMFQEALFGPSPAAEVLLAAQGGLSIGFALFFHTFSTWTGRRGLWLEDLYVTPEARGSGAGGALLQALAQVALDRGCPRLEWTVLDWNTPALDFYRAKGALPQDEWTTQRVTGEALRRLAGQAA
ncbi:GNAT family N-acetyltransferase [Sphingomonas sp. ABOLG]|jgi:GNAT superfamily N-acetyltransferase|uniref:GNAT family N-acetyltransferase n=1 Tax=Sphingomonas olei TaxID=1886787 RepID=A0ABY2QJV5_9SPHN|nr:MULTISPECIES: GNAT family N-acetyltransferase [Sphingomonas]RSV13900.1 GNAT family N-acetyltransferase [Sphingomonas sp. ABOLG]THG40830.1 GNAT family N-acetyltransferase [Sphingomonas olei]